MMGSNKGISEVVYFGFGINGKWIWIDFGNDNVVDNVSFKFRISL